MGSQFGELRYVKLSSPNMGTLVYRNHVDADLALRQLKGASNTYGTNICVSIKAQGLSPPVLITNISSSLVMSWPTSKSTKEVGNFLITIMFFYFYFLVLHFLSIGFLGLFYSKFGERSVIRPSRQYSGSRSTKYDKRCKGNR